MSVTNIFQIYYDDDSYDKLEMGFIPLDNSGGRPDWYEFWAILNYLKNNKLEDDTWYGFLSPRFSEKTGFNSRALHSILNDPNVDNNYDAVLFATSWDQNCYFKNPFEQGEYHHKGFLKTSQKFVDEIGLNLKLKDIVTYSDTSVFGNFVVAKKNYWIKWLELAEKLFDICENNKIQELNQETEYGDYGKRQTKVFLQERLASLVLLTNNFNVISIDQTLNGQMLVNLHLESMFYEILTDNFKTFRHLLTCDVLKEQFYKTKNKDFLKIYEEIRKNVKIYQK